MREVWVELNHGVNICVKEFGTTRRFVLTKDEAWQLKEDIEKILKQKSLDQLEAEYYRDMGFGMPYPK